MEQTHLIQRYVHWDEAHERLWSNLTLACEFILIEPCERRQSSCYAHWRWWRKLMTCFNHWNRFAQSHVHGAKLINNDEASSCLMMNALSWAICSAMELLKLMNNTTKQLVIVCENIFWEPCARKGHKTRWRSWTTMKQAYDLWMIVIYFSWSHVHGNDSCELLSSKLTIDRELILFEPCAREAHAPIWSKLTVDCEFIFFEPQGHIDADRAH